MRVEAKNINLGFAQNGHKKKKKHIYIYTHVYTKLFYEEEFEKKYKTWKKVIAHYQSWSTNRHVSQASLKKKKNSFFLFFLFGFHHPMAVVKTKTANFHMHTCGVTY